MQIVKEIEDNEFRLKSIISEIVFKLLHRGPDYR